MRIFNRLTLLAAIAATTAVVAGQANAQEDRGVMSQKRAYKGYEKRQRIMPAIDSVNVSPSQLHEVYGWEVGAAGTYKQATQSIQGNDVRSVAPGALISTLYGGDVIVAGVDIGFSNVATEPQDDQQIADFEENLYTVKPAVALSFTDNITFGLSGDFIMNQATQKEFAATPEDTIDSNYATATAGMSYHTSKMEAGVAYTTFAKDSPRFDDSDVQVEVYVPAQSMIFARGNMTDNWSLMGAASFVDYERAAQGSDAVFDKYRLDDRLGGSATLTYWTAARSSVNLTAKYVPATAAAQKVGSYLAATNLTNQYGGSIDYIRSFNKQQYLGLTAGYERGERAETVDGIRYAAQQEKLTVGATFNAKI